MIIEVCCGSAADVLNSALGGATRAELCSSLFFGGLTPSMGSFLTARRGTDIEIAVMIRPREGGFCYSETEFAVMLEDASAFIDAGATAIVFGCLNPDSTINKEQCSRLVRLAHGRADTVFHRAFDVCNHTLLEGASILIDLGITRLLTSGREVTAAKGSENIKLLIDHCGDRLAIQPGGGVRANNIEALARSTGCTMVHTSGLTNRSDPSGLHSEIFFNGTALPTGDCYREVSSAIIRDFSEKARGL